MAVNYNSDLPDAPLSAWWKKHTDCNVPPLAPVRMTVHWIWKFIYVLGILLFLRLVLLSVVNGQYGPAILFVCLIVLTSLAMMFARSYVEVDHDQILISSPPFGKYLIRWDEISNVETNGLGYVFRGHGKALGFNTAMGTKAADMREVIRAELATRRIEVRRVILTPSVWPKNTRVR